jgi:hypothetical protein
MRNYIKKIRSTSVSRMNLNIGNVLRLHGAATTKVIEEGMTLRLYDFLR